MTGFQINVKNIEHYKLHDIFLVLTQTFAIKPWHMLRVNFQKNFHSAQK